MRALLVEGADEMIEASLRRENLEVGDPTDGNGFSG
jgi:hypothetical protein